MMKTSSFDCNICSSYIRQGCGLFFHSCATGSREPFGWIGTNRLTLSVLCHIYNKVNILELFHFCPFHPFRPRRVNFWFTLKINDYICSMNFKKIRKWNIQQLTTNVAPDANSCRMSQMVVPFMWKSKNKILFCLEINRKSTIFA